MLKITSSFKKQKWLRGKIFFLQTQLNMLYLRDLLVIKTHGGAQTSAFIYYFLYMCLHFFLFDCFQIQGYYFNNHKLSSYFLLFDIKSVLIQLAFITIWSLHLPRLLSYFSMCHVVFKVFFTRSKLPPYSYICEKRAHYQNNYIHQKLLCLKKYHEKIKGKSLTWCFC